jgi:hypothetical protein
VAKKFLEGMMKHAVVIFFIMLLVVNVGFSQKKVEFEISAGVGRVNPATIYQRTSGLDALIYQYAQHYKLDTTFTGGFLENKLFIPFNVSLNYRLNDKFYLKAGVDYCVSHAVSEKSFQVDWEDFNENHDYNLTDKISYLMPHIGFAYMPGVLGFHGAVGMGFARFTHIEELDYSEPGYGYEISDTFNVSGTGLGVILGVKYRIRLGKKSSGRVVHAFLKLESVILKVNTLNGDKTRTAVNANGQRVSETEAGTLYGFEWNPYGKQRIDFWDIFETPPTDSAMRNFQELGLNLSGIRFMIGISF